MACSSFAVTYNPQAFIHSQGVSLHCSMPSHRKASHAMYMRLMLLNLKRMHCCARTGNIIFSGQVGTVSLASLGTGRVYVSGVTQAVSVNLNGLGSAVIDAASGERCFARR